MIDVTNQKFIICQNPNLEQELRKYLISFNGIDIIDEDDFDLRAPVHAYYFGTYSAAYKALEEIKKLGYHNAEILILETVVHARVPTEKEKENILYDSAVSKLTDDEYQAVAKRVMMRHLYITKMSEEEA